MDTVQILQAFLALIFVLGLMFLTLWLIKFCQQKGLNCKLSKNFSAKNRLQIIEQRRLDIKNSVVLLRCDDEEFFLLLGAQNNIVLKQTQLKKESTAK